MSQDCKVWLCWLPDVSGLQGEVWLCWLPDVSGLQGVVMLAA